MTGPARKTSLTRSASWLVTGKLIGFASTIALPIVLVRHLSTPDFGTYRLVFLVVNSAVAMLPFGFGMTALYFIPREPELRTDIVRNTLFALGCVGLTAIAISLLFPQFVGFVAKDPGASIYAPWIGVIAALWIVGSFFEMMALAQQEARVATVIIVGNQASRAALLLGAATLFGTVRSLLVASLIQGLLLNSAMMWYLHRSIPGFFGRMNWTLLRRQLSYGIPLGLGAMLFQLQNDLHSYVVSSRFGAELFGVYSIGVFQLPLVFILLEASGAVLIPEIARLQKTGDTHQMAELTMRAARKLAILVFPLYAILAVTHREFIEFVFTKKYTASAAIFLVNITLIPFYVINTDPLQRAFREHQRAVLLFRTLLLTTSFFVLLWTVSRFGLIGAITTVVGTSLVERFWLWARFGRIVNLQHRPDLFAPLGRIALAVATAAIPTEVLRRTLRAGDAHLFLTLMACGIVFSIAYGLLVLGLRILTETEIGQIRRIFRRLALRSA